MKTGQCRACGHSGRRNEGVSCRESPCIWGDARGGFGLNHKDGAYRCACGAYAIVSDYSGGVHARYCYRCALTVGVEIPLRIAVYQTRRGETP